MAKTDEIFASILLPGEAILWTAESNASPRSWRSCLALVGAGLALMAVFSPRLFSLIQACVAAKSLFPLQFMGFKGMFAMLFPVLIGVWALLFGIGLLRQRRPLVYGLSRTRVFVAATDPKRRWTTASVMQSSGTVTVAQAGEAFTLSVPIVQSGQFGPDVDLERLSKTQYEAAFAIVNKIVGVQKP